jgi:hypothetical protein
MVPMTATPLVNLSALIDDAKCFALALLPNDGPLVLTKVGPPLSV